MARPEKRPLVEAGLGDLLAEPGSQEWALGARASLWGKDRDMGKGVADVAMRLDALLTTGGWKHLFDQHGDPFASIEDYITYRRPYGLGVSLDMMRHYLGLTHEGKAIRAHLAVKGYPTYHIAVTGINRTGGTQVREKTDAVKVAEYAEAIEGGAAFPPIVVFFDGETHWLADGFHRVAACEKAGVADVLAEVREGTREDALWFALSANKRHGLPMSNADKQRAIRLALETKPNESDRKIAAHIGVSHVTVAKIRAEVEAGVSTGQVDQLTPPSKTEGLDGKARSRPGEAESKAREFFESHPDLTNKSDRQIAATLNVARATVAKVRKERETAPSPAQAETPPASDPAPPSEPAPVVAAVSVASAPSDQVARLPGEDEASGQGDAPALDDLRERARLAALSLYNIAGTIDEKWLPRFLEVVEAARTGWGA